MTLENTDRSEESPLDTPRTVEELKERLDKLQSRISSLQEAQVVTQEVLQLEFGPLNPVT